MGYAAGQPLSVEAITEYGRANGFCSDMRFFLKAVSHLDDQHVKEQAAKLKAENAKRKTKSKGRK